MKINEITEAWDVPNIKKKESGPGPVYQDEEHILQHNGKLISKTSDGHLVYKTGNKGTSRIEYHAVNPITKTVDVSVDANEKNNVLTKILLVAAKDNTISATDFYYHLIVNLNKVLVHDMLSPGGKAVLKKLNTKYHAKIATHAWLHGQPLNLTDKDDEYVYGSGRETSEIRDAEDIELVTYKK